MMERKLQKKFELKNFKCEEKLCTKAFRTGDGLKQHVKAVHWNAAGGGSGDPAGLRTQMKPKKIDKSAINLLPLATLPYNMKVVIIPVHSFTIVRLICNDFISENDPMTESMIF